MVISLSRCCLPNDRVQPPQIFFPRTAPGKAWSWDHMSSVCPSVTLVDHGHIGWKSWKRIARTLSPTSSLYVAQRSSTYSPGNMEKFWGENVRSTPTSITSSWTESSSTESQVILGGDVTVCLLAVCLLLSAHRAVIFSIAQLSCFVFDSGQAARGAYDPAEPAEGRHHWRVSGSEHPPDLLHRQRDHCQGVLPRLQRRRHVLPRHQPLSKDQVHSTSSSSSSSLSWIFRVREEGEHFEHTL